MNKLLSVLLSSVLLVQTAAPASAAVSGDGGHFIYRYKDGVAIATPGPDTQEKDIVAYYIGGVGFNFDQALPMKPEWQDDTWSVVSGTLPDGIEFDPATRRFRGTPTTPGTSNVAFLKGVDANGNQVAEAKVSFDIRTIRGIPVPTDLYAHTGKYKLDEIKVPDGIAVKEWEQQSFAPLPDGIAARGTTYIDGVPQKAGVWPLFIVGLDYNGEAVVTFFGSYTVEDGPSFPHIPDMVYKLPQVDLKGYGLKFDFGAPGTHAVNRQLDPSRPVKYFLEIQDPDGRLPGNVATGGKLPALTVKGDVKNPYDTAVVRYRALDSDDTVGYSNWFTFGSSDPQPDCNPYYNPTYPVRLVTGQVNNVNIPRPFGLQGKTVYSVVSGSLPSGIALDSATGVLNGTPKTSGEKSAFTVNIDVVNDEGTVSTQCFFNTEVFAGGASVSDATPKQDRHVRVGAPYKGTVKAAGGIPTYSLSFADPAAYPGLAFSSPTTDVPYAGISGSFSTSGLHQFDVKMDNGDGTAVDGTMSVRAYDDLNAPDAQDIHVKRLEAPKTWGAVAYDVETVIPDVNNGNQPTIELSPSAKLPDGISFSAKGTFSGETAAKVGSYGPMTATISDYTGDKFTTTPFNVIVDEREKIDAILGNAPEFVVERDSSQSVAPVTVKQPYGAALFTVTYELLPNSLPQFLSFDPETGAITANASIPYSEKNEAGIGPYAIKVTDSDGSTDTSDEFLIKIRDWAAPVAADLKLQKFNVTGNTSRAEDTTTLFVDGLRSAIDNDTVIGGRELVTFKGANPSSVGGVSFDPATGTFAGIPTSEFKGDVEVGFEDSKGREGKIKVPFEIRPYPSLTMPATTFELPRLASVASLEVPPAPTLGNGFWTPPTFDLAPGSSQLPAGLQINANSGAVIGRTTEAVDTVVSGIVVRATTVAPNGQTLHAFTDAFSIKVTKQEEMTLTFDREGESTFYHEEKDAKLGIYEFATKTLAKGTVGGSYVAPLTYELDDKAARQGNGTDPGMTGTLAINPTTGILTGYPDRIGIWTVYVKLTDAEGQKLASPVALQIKSTLNGPVRRSNGGGSLTLRQEEPFETDAIDISNFVPNARFEATPATMPTTVMAGFDPLTGAFSDISYFPLPVTGYTVEIAVKDAHDRKFFGGTQPKLQFTVKPRLEVSTAPVVTASRQYDVSERLDLSFNPSVKEQIGGIRYSLIGNAPGTRIDLVYDKNGSPVAYDWTDTRGARYVLDIDGGLTPTAFRIDGVAQSLKYVTGPDGNQVAAPASSYMPLDALVFDTISATLRGIPSKSGTFSLAVQATDDHMDAYIRDVATKTEYNTATSDEFAFTVAPAAVLSATANQLTETVAQYTGRPTTVLSPVNHAYGVAPTWTLTAGAMPNRISGAASGNDLAFRGYPDTLGTRSGIVWTVKDAAGRTAQAPAVEVTVGPRGDFGLVAQMSPAGYVVNLDITPNAVTPVNAAFGAPIADGDWSVSANPALPAGIVYTIGGGKVVFSGKPTALGSSDVTITARDATGASATMTLKVSSISPTDEIILNVSTIRTKANYPYAMQASSDNTFGTVRFYSKNVSNELASQLSLNGTTGLVSGMFLSEGDRTFDLYVTDDTKRVTGRTVLVNVMPQVRTTVPLVVQTPQGVALDRAVSTDYVIGTATYAKGSGTWPDGIVVNPVTGSISAASLDDKGKVVNIVDLKDGDYPDLTLRVTDTFTVGGTTYTDTTESNAFTLRVTPGDFTPLARTQTKTILGTEGSTITPMRVLFDTKETSTVWNWGGSTYAPSHDLSQYGLTFDRSTGTITGTPTKPFIIPDFQVRLTSFKGLTAMTQTFWIGVAPKEPLAFDATMKTSYTQRSDAAVLTAPAPVKNYIGTLAFAVTTDPLGNFSVTADGTLKHGTVWPKTVVDTQPIGGWVLGMSVTDEFGRQATQNVNFGFVEKLTATGGSLIVELDTDIKDLAIATTTGVVGPAVYEATGLPAGLTINATTGLVSGKIVPNAADPNAPKNGDVFAVTFKVTDNFDGATATASVSMKVQSTGAHRYWKFSSNFSNVSSINIHEMYMLGDNDASIDSLVRNGTATFPLSTNSSRGRIFDGNDASAAYWNRSDYFRVDFKSPQKIITIKMLTSNLVPPKPGFTVEYSDDDKTWKKATVTRTDGPLVDGKREMVFEIKQE
jgi:hypothetical protein